MPLLALRMKALFEDQIICAHVLDRGWAVTGHQAMARAGSEVYPHDGHILEFVPQNLAGASTLERGVEVNTILAWVHQGAKNN